MSFLLGSESDKMQKKARPLLVQSLGSFNRGFPQHRHKNLYVAVSAPRDYYVDVLFNDVFDNIQSWSQYWAAINTTCGGQLCGSHCDLGPHDSPWGEVSAERTPWSRAWHWGAPASRCMILGSLREPTFDPQTFSSFTSKLRHVRSLWPFFLIGLLRKAWP